MPDGPDYTEFKTYVSSSDVWIVPIVFGLFLNLSHVSPLMFQDRMKLRASARSGKSFSGLLQNRKKNGEAHRQRERALFAIISRHIVKVISCDKDLYSGIPCIYH